MEDFYRNLSGRKIETDDDYQIETQEYQGGATAILQILKTQVSYLEIRQITKTPASWFILFTRCPMREPTR